MFFLDPFILMAFILSPKAIFRFSLQLWYRLVKVAQTSKAWSLPLTWRMTWSLTPSKISLLDLILLFLYAANWVAFVGGTIVFSTMSHTSTSSNTLIILSFYAPKLLWPSSLCSTLNPKVIFGSPTQQKMKPQLESLFSVWNLPAVINSLPLSFWNP